MDSSVRAHDDTYLCYYTIVNLQVSKSFKQVQDISRSIKQATTGIGGHTRGAASTSFCSHAGLARSDSDMRLRARTKKPSIPHNTQVIVSSCLGCRFDVSSYFFSFFIKSVATVDFCLRDRFI
jgi:hypothetical protein